MYIYIYIYISFLYILYVASFMYTLYITMLCLFKAQYVHYEGNNLQQKGDEYTVKQRLYLVCSLL